MTFTIHDKGLTNISGFYDPIGVAFDSSNGYVYVANSFNNSVSVINGATNTVITNISGFDGSMLS